MFLFLVFLGANLEISSACNILGAMGVLEQSHVDERANNSELLGTIAPNLPEPPADESKVDDYLSFLAFRWSKTIESVIAETQSVDITSASSLPAHDSTQKHSKLLDNKFSLSSQYGNSETMTNRQSSSSSLSYLNSGGLSAQHNLSGSLSSVGYSASGMEQQPQQRQSNTNNNNNNSNCDEMDFVDLLLQSTSDPMVGTAEQPKHSAGLNNGKDLQRMNNTNSSDSQPQQSIPFTSTSSSYQTSTFPQIHFPSQLVNDSSELASSLFVHPSSLGDPTAKKDQPVDPKSGGPQLLRKSASSTKIWKLRSHLKKNRLGKLKELEESDDEITKFLYAVEKVLNSWGEKAFQEHAILEIEEKMLRRLAGQCEVSVSRNQRNSSDNGNNLINNTNDHHHINLSPAHIGTRYLDAYYSNNNVENILMMTNATSFVPSSSSAKNNNKSSHQSRKASGNSHQSLSFTPSDPQIQSSSQFYDASSFDYNEGVALNLSSLPKEYEFSDSINSQTLIEKVKKSKRQKGHCLTSSSHNNNGANDSFSSPSGFSPYSPNQFNSSYLNSLRHISQKTIENFWQFESSSSGFATSPSAEDNHNAEILFTKRTPKPISFTSTTSISTGSGASGGNSIFFGDQQMTMSDFSRTVYQNNIQITNSFLNSNNFNANNVLLSGASPNISVNTFKKYVPPLHIVDFAKKYNFSSVSSSSTSGSKRKSAQQSSQQDSSNKHALISAPICYPDLMITTLEIPWKSIVPEFQVVKSDEMGLSFLPASESTDFHQTHNLHSSEIQKISKSKSTDKISRSQSFDSGSHLLPSLHSGLVNSTIFRSRAVSEVFAPSFREVPNYTSDRKKVILSCFNELPFADYYFLYLGGGNPEINCEENERYWITFREIRIWD
jgi:ElaB/YqjD/DUF883 family membrane-anchored ribosome-binding protein